MRAFDLLFEKGLRIGQRELEQGAAIGDLFTFGFEAELGYRYDDRGDAKYYGLEELEDISDLTHALELHPNDVNRLEKKYREWRDQTAGEIAQSKLDDDEIDEDEYDQEYEEIWNGLTENQWIEQEGIEEIIAELNPQGIDWEIEDTELIINRDDDNNDMPTDKQIEEVLNNFVSKTGYPATPHSRRYEEYSITYDSSVETRDDGDLKIEVVSPVFESLEEFEDNMLDVFRWIDNVGYTNDSTGFHINIGFQNKNTEIDLLKLQLLVGDEYIAKMFGRRFNEYSNTVEHYITQKVQMLRDDEFAKLMDPRTRGQQLEEWLDALEKQRSINAKKLATHGFLEFRITGGENYETKSRKIMETVQRYLYVLKIAADPDAGRREYLSKLGRLMSKAVSQKPVQKRSEAIRLYNMFNGKVSQHDIEFYLKNKETASRGLPMFIMDILVHDFSAEDILTNKKVRTWLQKEMKAQNWTPRAIGEVLWDFRRKEAMQHRDDLEKLGFISDNQTTS